MTRPTDDRLGELLREALRAEAGSWQPDVTRAADQLRDRATGESADTGRGAVLGWLRRHPLTVVVPVAAASLAAAAVVLLALPVRQATTSPPPAAVRPEVVASLRVSPASPWARSPGRRDPRCTDPVPVEASLRVPSAVTSLRYNWSFGPRDDGQPRTELNLPAAGDPAPRQVTLRHVFTLPVAARNDGSFSVGLLLLTRAGGAAPETTVDQVLRASAACRP